MNLVRAPVDRAVYFDAQCVVDEYNMVPTSVVNGDYYKTFNRYDYGGATWYGAVDSIGVDSSVRFNNLRPNFREFAITGMKIEITPNDRDSVPF